MIQPLKIVKHLGMHLDDSLTFHTHADEVAAQGHKYLALLTTLRHKHRGLLTFTALYLIKTAFLPKMLWASPVWWTGSQHILDRLELVYHRALRWASGLPRFTANRKLFLLTCSPPLRCILDYLSARYAICLLFAADSHPLQQHIYLAGREVQLSWLSEMKIQQSTITYPTLHKLLSLVARFLKAGKMLADLNTTGPTPNFLTAIFRTEEASEGPTKHLEYVSQQLTPTPNPPTPNP